MKSLLIREAVLIEKKPKSNDAGFDWVFITTLNGRTRAISFEELYYTCTWIGECEDIKYPESYHKGKTMVTEFLIDTMSGNFTYAQLAEKYKLPQSTQPRDPRQLNF